MEVTARCREEEETGAAGEIQERPKTSTAGKERSLGKKV